MADEENNQGNTTDNTLAQHGDERIEEQREKYGDLAYLTREQLQEEAQEEGVEAPSEKSKEELLDILTG